MSDLGESVESTRLLYTAQVENDGRQQNARYYASHHRQTRHARLMPNQTPPLRYGTTPLVQDTKRQHSPPARDERREPYDDCLPTCQPPTDCTEASGNYWFCMILRAAISFIMLLTVFHYWFGSGGQQSSVPNFPEPNQPEELERYRKSGIYWDHPQPLECRDQYHYSEWEYTARLLNVSRSKDFNVIKACKSLPIKIHNHAFETPDKCRRRLDAHIYGYWTVHDPQVCTIEDEIQKYRSSGMRWDLPQPAPHCHSFNKREYEAHLLGIPAGYDWNKACSYMPITIKDQSIEKPDSCERRNSGEYGKWLVSEQLDCKPYWGPLSDVGCQASGKKRYEAPLWNLIEGDDWYAMCASTQATWNGRYYEHPTNCDYRKRGGMIGIWEGESCS